MKAKLIIDMPDNCSECRLWRFTQMGFMVCAVNGKLVGAENSHEKPDWCPLTAIGCSCPNYRELPERDCCDNCINFDWDETGNSQKCFKYDIEFTFGDNLEYDMICDSHIKKLESEG